MDAAGRDGNPSRFRFVPAMERSTRMAMTGRILFDIEALIGLGGLLAVALAWDALKAVLGRGDRGRDAHA